MTALPFTKAEREDILLRRVQTKQEYGRVVDEEFARDGAQPDENRISAALKLATQANELYEAGLHRVQMSVCPICAEPFHHSFDPFGMDGPWWGGVRGAERPACTHYCFFRGAVHFGTGPRPKGPYRAKARPGPEVPYVIPKQLELPGVVAVIGELEMEPGWTAYPIVYFGDPRPAAELLSSDWCQSMYSYVRSTGQPETSYPNDPWDFELEPWLARGKLLWCVPGSGNSRLANPRGTCPYVDLPGIRESIEIDERSKLRTRGTPDGSMILPFE